MRILYNATLTPPMNDTSVTSGNADGWVLAAIPLREMTAGQSDGAMASARGRPRRIKSRAVPKKKHTG